MTIYKLVVLGDGGVGKVCLAASPLPLVKLFHVVVGNVL
jgi:hypothetical protein